MAFVLVSICGCQKAPPPAKADDKPAFLPPTATEIFNLRSKCADLGEKLLQADLIGPTLAHEATSRYDPKTNRCYVRIDIHMADLTRYDELYSSYLYDGQTGEMLAWIKSQNGKNTGFSSIGGDSGYDGAIMIINNMMYDDRKQ